jgi:hypothetical protein
MASHNHIIGVKPAFYLNINPVDVINNYHNGLYDDIDFPEKKIKISGSNLSHKDINSKENDIYLYKDRYNVLHDIASTNCESYEIFMKDGTIPPSGGICKWCNYSFSHTALGVLIRKLIKRNPNNQLEKIHIFYMDSKTFCSFECTLAYIIKELDKGYKITNPHYNSSLSLLILLYSIMYPNDSDLIPAGNPDLLQINKGSLSKSEYRHKNHLYKPIPTVILAPVKFLEEKIPQISK